MNKRVKFIKYQLLSIIILIIILPLIILIHPTKYYINDGGSYGYNTILYDINFHRASKELYPDAEHGVSVRIFLFEFYWKTE